MKKRDLLLVIDEPFDGPFDEPSHRKADHALSLVEPWVMAFCKSKRALFEKNYHNSPSLNVLAVGRDKITRKLQLGPFLTKSGELEGYILGAIAWIDSGGRRKWWTLRIHTFKRLPNKSHVMRQLLDNGWDTLSKVTIDVLRDA